MINDPSSPDNPNLSKRYPPINRPMIIDAKSSNSSFDYNFVSIILKNGTQKGINKSKKE